MASIPPHISNLDATHISTWRPFRPTSQFWTPPTSAHGVHSAPHPQSGRRPHQHMASIPPHIPNLDAAHISTWRPFRPTSQIWTPLTPAHGVHSSQHPQSGRRPHQHMASIPPQISNLDATPTLTWRPFRRKSPIWTPPSLTHCVHSAPHPNSGRHPLQHMASIPPHIPNLDAIPTLTWRPFRPPSQFRTPLTPTHGVHSAQHLKSGRRPHQHMAYIPLNIPNLDAALISTWRPFRPTSTIWTPHQLSHGVHSAPHLKSGRRSLQHMASIPPHISNLDAALTSSWRPFRHTSQIWTPPSLARGVHSAPHLKSGRRSLQHMASIPLVIPNLDATSSPHWRPFLPPSQFWTPHRRRPLQHMASIPLNIPILDAAHINTWRPFLSTSQFWTPPTSTHGVHFSLHPQSGRRSLQHMASIPPHIPILDAALTSSWRPFRPTSQIWTPLTPAHGVHSAPHLKSGRRPLQHMASIPPNIPNLDAA